MSESTENSLGKYRLIAELGRGGMAEVYLAVTRSSPLDFMKLVVLKKPRAHLADDAEFITMLVDEARIAARLNHPNLVQTLEVGTDDGEYFLTMEYLDGQPLHRIANRARDKMPRAMQLAIILDVLAGIHYAHELKDFDGTPLGIVHRDVTPHNIFVTYDGQVKVVDFGIAKAVGRASETRHGIVKGKRAYMAPEQARGTQVDRRVDIFAVGVTLFEAVARRRLWAGVEDAEIVTRLVTNRIPASPKAVDPSIDDELDRICRKALAYSPNDRYDTAAAFARELETYMTAHEPRPSARDLGDYVSSLFDDKRKATAAVIEQQLAALRKGSKVSVAAAPATSTSVSGVKPGKSSSSVRTERPPANAPPTPRSSATNGSNRAPASVASVDSSDGDPSGATETHVDEEAKTKVMKTKVMAQPPQLVGRSPGMRIPSPAAFPAAGPPAPRPVPPPAPSSATAPHGPATSDAFAVQPRPPSRLRAISAGLGLALVAAAIVYAALHARPKPQPTTPETTPSASASAPPSASAPASVTITLRATPPQTKFTIDDGAPLSNPFTGTFPRDEQPHRIRASAPGYVGREETTTFHEDISLRFSLARTSK